MRTLIVQCLRTWKSDTSWIIEIKCPFCGDEHQHNGGYEERAEGGLRLAKCFGKIKGSGLYQIEIGD
jgi:hypothetical protein